MQKTQFYFKVPLSKLEQNLKTWIKEAQNECQISDTVQNNTIALLLTERKKGGLL